VALRNLRTIVQQVTPRLPAMSQP